MAKKTRKQKQRAAASAGRRQAAPAQRAQPLPASGVATAAPAEDFEAAAGIPPLEEGAGIAPQGAGDLSAAPGRRRVERLSPAATVARPAARQQQRGASTAAMFRPLESDDAAIPFDRVPYVPADLRRVAIMAACMVALIIVAAVIVSRVVT